MRGNIAQRSRAIWRAEDVAPHAGLGRAFEEIGLPGAPSRVSGTWRGLLRLARTVAELEASQITTLAENAESCMTLGRTENDWPSPPLLMPGQRRPAEMVTASVYNLSH